MLTMPETDANLATLEKKIDVGFACVEENFKRVDERFEQVEARSAERFELMEARSAERFQLMEKSFAQRFDGMDSRADRMEGRVDSMHRIFIQVCAGMLSTLIIALVTVLATVN
jgi:Flp pilus assembly protein TadB